MNEHNGLLELELAGDLPSVNMAVRDDAAVAALTKMMRYNYGPQLTPSSVILKRPRPADTTPWDTFFGCEIEYGARRNEIHIPLEIVVRCRVRSFTDGQILGSRSFVEAALKDHGHSLKLKTKPVPTTAT